MSTSVPGTPHHDHRATPIPLSLAHLPVVGGLAVPWITLASPDGRYLFGSIDADRQRFCLYERHCQICGFDLEQPFLLLARNRDLARQLTAEPGLHPWCADYTTRACPMVNGQLDHYRRTRPDIAELFGLPSHALQGESPDQTQARRTAPAETWFTVWLNEYHVIWDDLAKSLTASFEHSPILRIRRVPGQVIA